MKQDNDAALISDIQRNDKKAFDLLFRKYYTPLCRYALKLSESEEMAEEAVQEVFIVLWEQRLQLNISKSVIGYLFQAVRNKVYENFRKTQTRMRYEEESASQLAEQDISSDSTDDYEVAVLIWNAVEQLPDKCKVIFQLSRDEGLTYNEIAKHLGISPKTVENQMGIAFKKLREIMSPMFATIRKANNHIDVFFLGVLAFLIIIKKFKSDLGVSDLAFIY